VTDASPAPPTLAAAMRKEVDPMQLAGHSIRVIVALAAIMTSLVSIVPATSDASHAKATYWCPPMC
jgi:hypothetical protein